MKKIFYITILVVISYVANSQAFSPGQIVISAGVGFGSNINPQKIEGSEDILNDVSNIRQLPGFSVNTDIKDPNRGRMGVGLFLGINRFQWQEELGNGYTESLKWLYGTLGLRISLHHTSLKNEKLDLYAGIMPSYTLAVAHYTISAGGDEYKETIEGGDGFGVSAYVGGRYFFSPGLALNAEAGYGITLLKLGLTFKF